ncbi:MFS transporter [Sulfurospirillum sp. T05]|uniref:MFS transporter n=1 Tax=Sulfurospirillum tamanense TaxID=2813362 RepID=A0ABS2WRZ8_9BACT|nr:MFS transporter [Sulfurospirillum tamanensis]MBN2964429.1 MFS transporter [Sulfurospirillum tamanensis]
MKRHVTVVASFVIMLCIGNVYAWSLIASELMREYGFSAFESQIVFGVIIAVFPVTMIFVGQLGKTVKHRYFGYISGVLFFLGYLLASFSQGNFLIVLVGIGVLSGVGTGFGYWVALTSPVQWFPEKKGLIAGIAAAGFGLGAVFMSEISGLMLESGYDVLELIRIIGISYGVIILLFSNFIFQRHCLDENKSMRASDFIKAKIFKKLFFGIFLGTFAGLLVIGSLGIIGSKQGISGHALVLGVALFAVANFTGRLIWGFLSDRIGASLSIFLALLFQSLAIIGLNILPLSPLVYLMFAVFVGFGFGGNFVLFAKETAQVYGVQNLGIVYPYVFLGYAIAGIAGPITGGFLYDVSGSFFYPILLASFVSFMGSVLFLQQHIREIRSKPLGI